METLVDNITMKESVTKKYLELHKLYKHTDKVHILRQAENHLIEGSYESASRVLEQLETREQLLESLMRHLQHKSVHRTLERIMAGKTSNLYESLKGLFSLGTHICIELERGNLQYRGLLDEVLESIQRNLK